jgi:peptidoglycan hydrolase-like protein with peptidoglycan-binding domain
MRFQSAAILVLSGALAAPVFAHNVHHTRHHARSSDVRAAQEKLSDMGYDVGEADGKVGPKTHAALRKFQADKGLAQTGRLDAHTRAALDMDHGSTTSGAR